MYSIVFPVGAGLCAVERSGTSALGVPLPPSHDRTLDKPSVGGDAHIAPYATAAPWHHAKGTFRAPARGTFALGGKSTQKRRSNLRFENPLRAFSCCLSCLLFPREHCAVQISPKCCIVSAPLSAAAFALKCRTVRFFNSRQELFSKSGPWPPPTFAASRQRRDLIIASPKGRGFQRGGVATPPVGRFKGKGSLRKGGNRNPPFLKWRSLVTFFRQGKKVTRRRQRKGKGTKSPRAG